MRGGLMLTALVVLLGACRSDPELQRYSATHMSAQVQVWLPERPDSARAADEVFATFAEVELRASEWREGSAVAALNQGATEPVPVHADLLALTQRSLALADTTRGAFDPSWAALWGLWDFQASPPALPDPAAVQQRLALVDWRAVEVDPAASTLRLPRAGMKLGFGAVAKGWALDRAAEGLRARGFDDFMLSAGGQVLTAGTHGGEPWLAGLQAPRGERGERFAELTVTDASLSTSGDYERFFELDGRRYHHLIDPRTGWPAEGLRSVSVMAPDATTADALSTALFVLGPAEGPALVEQLTGVEAVFVDEGGWVTVSSGLRALICDSAARPRTLKCDVPP